MFSDFLVFCNKYACARKKNVAVCGSVTGDLEGEDIGVDNRPVLTRPRSLLLATRRLE